MSRTASTQLPQIKQAATVSPAPATNPTASPGQIGPVTLRRFDMETRRFVTSRVFDRGAIQVLGLPSGR